MLRFILSRLAQSFAVIFVVITATFFLVRLAPGDPFSSERRIPEFIKQRILEHYGLDRPAIEQYWNFIRNAAPKRFRPDRIFEEDPLMSAFGINLGPSFTQARTVNQIIADTFPVSLELGFWALVIALSLGLTAGLTAAIFKNSALDYVPMSAAMVGICLPTFVMGPILALIFGVWLGWFNVSGWFLPQDRVLPAVTLGLVYAAVIARITRGGMLEILSQDFIRTAQAKGVPYTRIVFKHTLRGGLLPVVTFMGPALAGIISGSFVVETIFQIPGLGRQFVQSAFNRDYFLVLGTVSVYAVLITLANLTVDIVQVILNPRLRFED
ncbi:MAG: ABC transporter permease [Opitutales bacterium]|nr:ABC transporter permease [Opitutales bacterium]